MNYFEGKQFSTITDIMPARQWERELFLSDWKRQMAEAGTLFNDADIEMALETVLSSFYNTYEQCVAMIGEEDFLETEQKQKMIARLNLAMTKLLEFGQRSSDNIAKSLLDQKLSRTESGGEFFNDLIDLLVQELRQAELQFHERQEEFYAHKRQQAAK